MALSSAQPNKATKRPKKVTRSTAEDFDGWLEEMPDRYIDCRNDHHRWRMLRATWDPKMNNYSVWHRCTSCRCGRERRISSTGLVLNTRYEYPEHYLAPKGTLFDKDARAEVRLVGITRWLDKNAGTSQQSDVA